MAVQTVAKVKSTRRLSLNFTELKNILFEFGYTLDEALLREQVKYIPRFRGTYRQQCASLVVKKATSMPVFSTCNGILIGHFTDVAPWDNQRHKWEVRLNGSYVTGLSLYQFWVQVVK